MKKIIIVGAGGFGREAYYLIKDINKQCPTWEIKGFIDDNISSLEGKHIAIPIISTIVDYIPEEEDWFVMGIASPKGKEKVATILKERGARFATLIHPTACVNEAVEMGEGCVVTGGSIGDCSRLGGFVHVAGSMIGQDVMIGDYSTITGYVNVPSGILGKRVFIGSHSVVLNDLADDVEVVTGSIVFHKVRTGCKVMGYPAKKIEL